MLLGEIFSSDPTGLGQRLCHSSETSSFVLWDTSVMTMGQRMITCIKLLFVALSILPDKSNLMKGGLILVPSLRVQPIMAWKAW